MGDLLVAVVHSTGINDGKAGPGQVRSIVLGDG
jgi:hypothetical protein